MVQDLCFLGVTEAIELFRQGELSPVELLQAQLDRAKRIEPHLNAFCAIRTEQALEQARQAEAVYRKAPERARPLEGIPTVLKNEHLLVGEHTDQGSLLLGRTADTENSPITQRMLDAGAVIHARTNVPEFFVAGFTQSLRYGVTRNPWNPAYTCGGSSGGSAVALAAGTTTLATGSDIGGSIRVPSAYCGVVGLKPSYGRVPEQNMFFAMNTHNHNGVMARTVRDCIAMFNVVNGPHPVDPSTVKPKIAIDTSLAPVRGVRIALSIDLGYFDVHPEIAANTRAAAALLRDQGAIVDEVNLGWTAEVREAFTSGLVFTMGHMLEKAIEGSRDVVNPYVLNIAEMSQHITLDDYLASFEVIERMHAKLQDVFARYDALICPTLARNMTPAEGVKDAHLDLMNNAMTYPFNMLSRHPVLSIPSGMASHGVPTGLQIVGPTYDENRVLQIGLALESAIGWSKQHPKI
jgi:Asp-tRNA(Asn)/Glu-tRNA(Gln) amidotransferase A subunit family amidase